MNDTYMPGSWLHNHKHKTLRLRVKQCKSGITEAWILWLLHLVRYVSWLFLNRPELTTFVSQDWNEDSFFKQGKYIWTNFTRNYRIRSEIIVYVQASISIEVLNRYQYILECTVTIQMYRTKALKHKPYHFLYNLLSI